MTYHSYNRLPICLYENKYFHKSPPSTVVPLKVEYMVCTISKGLAYIITLYTITSLVPLQWHFTKFSKYVLPFLYCRNSDILKSSSYSQVSWDTLYSVQCTYLARAADSILGFTDIVDNLPPWSVHGTLNIKKNNFVSFFG